jgi:hypothetical protein
VNFSSLVITYQALQLENWNRVPPETLSKQLTAGRKGRTQGSLNRPVWLAPTTGELRRALCCDSATKRARTKGPYKHRLASIVSETYLIAAATWSGPIGTQAPARESCHQLSIESQSPLSSPKPKKRGTLGYASHLGRETSFRALLMEARDVVSDGRRAKVRCRAIRHRWEQTGRHHRSERGVHRRHRNSGPNAPRRHRS